MRARDPIVRISRSVLRAILLLTVFLPIGYAQDSLSVDRCMTLALEHSPRLRQTENAVRSVRLSMSELETAWLPQVTGSATASFAPVPPSFGYDPAISNGGEVAGQVVVRQSIYDGGIRGLRSDQLQIDLDRVTGERELASWDLTFAVKQAFGEAFRAQEEVDLRREGVKQLLAYSELVGRMYHGGSVGYTDVLKTDMQLSGARQALEQARQSFDLARLSLRELIGVAIDTTMRIARAQPDMPFHEADSTAARSDSGLTDNLDLHIANLLVTKSQLDVQLASRERAPQLSLVADAGYLSSVENLRLPKADRLTAVGYSIGVGVEIPLMNWGATDLRVQERELAADDVRLQKEILRRSLSAELAKTRLRSSVARERLLTLHDNIRRAEENFVLTKSKYAAGAALALEVLAAQQLHTDMRIDELQTKTEIYVTAARMERLTAQRQTHIRQ